MAIVRITRDSPQKQLQCLHGFQTVPSKEQQHSINTCFHDNNNDADKTSTTVIIIISLQLIFSKHSIYIVCVLSHEVYLTDCNPMDCSPPGSSGHGLLQARILKLPFPPPGDLPDPGIKPAAPALAGGLFTTELPGKPLCL